MFDIIKLAYKLDIIKIEYKRHEKTSGFKDSRYIVKTIKRFDGNWVDNGNNLLASKKIDKLLYDIITMRYVGIRTVKDETDLIKWQIAQPTFSINFDTTTSSIKMIVGTDAEENGYYYIALNDKMDTVYVINERSINLIRTGIKRLLDAY